MMPRSSPRSGNPTQAFTTALLLAAAIAAPVTAQPQPQATDLPAATLDAPFADPRLDVDLALTAMRITAWTDGTAQVLLLEGDARFELGVRGFTADAAVVRIETQTTDTGPVRHLAAFFENARPLPGTGPITGAGPQLLVTAATSGAVRLDRPGTLIRAQTAPAHRLIEPARASVAARRAAAGRPGLALAVDPNDPGGLPAAVAARRATRRARLTRESAVPTAQVSAAAGTAAAATPGDPANPTADPRRGVDSSGVLPARGVVAYTMDRWSVRPGDDETAVTLAGNVQLVFEEQPPAEDSAVVDDPSPLGVITLRADNVVLFLRSEEDAPPNLASGTPTPAGAGVQADQIAGIYLEDHVVINDGDYTVRAPRVYYDLQRKQATLLDATFYTYDRKSKIPLYVRAQEVRQTSAADYVARGATLSSSAFAVPHFSIGAEELTLRRYAQPDAGPDAQDNPDSEAQGSFFTARGTTLNAGEQPIFYWPYLAARGLDTPLRRVGADFSSNNGFELTSRWDVFSLLGRPRPEGSQWQADLDFRGDHGLGVGSRGRYQDDQIQGDHRGYLLVDDSGEDDVAGRVVPQRDAVRGFIQARHRQPVGRGYRVSLEGAFVSDPSFLETFFSNQADASKPYETSIHLQRQSGSTAVDLLASTRLSEFVEQQDLLQSRGFSVERLPEATHRVIGGTLLEGRATWFSEARLGQLRISPGDDAPEDRDFDAADSLALFGIAPETTFDERAQALNLPTDTVTRLDLRQEISLPLKGGQAGAWNFTPYAVGRLTAYDDSFEDFNNAANDDQLRLRGEVGLRVGTQFSKALPAVRSDLLNLNGLRHVVEPTLTVFAAGSTIDAGDLPIFDPEVERLAEGTGLRLGLTQTLQTRRGVENTTRTVDWLTLRTDLVLRDSGDPQALLPRFDDFRPEFAVGGDHFYTELLWMVTDTLGVAGELTHDFDSGRVAQWRTGITLEHSPRLTTQLAYFETEPLDSRLLRVGFDYTLTSKYRVGAFQTLDLGDNGTQNLAVVLDRRLPQWTLRLQVDFDELDDDQRIGFTLIPHGGSRDPRVF